MSLVLELPAELETELAAEAARLGLPLSEYALRILSLGRIPAVRPTNGSELVEYWKNTGLIGTRTGIADPAEHAREVRQQAQNRERS